MSVGQNIRMVSKEELHRSITWAYKWVRRFDKEGLDDRKINLEAVDLQMYLKRSYQRKIRTELSENPSGWKAKEIMDIIHRKTGVKYHEVHVYRLLHKWGFDPKVPRKRFVNTASHEERKQFKKRPRK